jgi:hypothetical protein
MASWKKVVVSGSAISQLNNDVNFISSDGQGILSSSAQISADISGSLSAAALVALGADLISGSASDVRTFLNVEDGATGDQTNAEIRTAVEAATDSNVFTDADHTKLDGIEASADVTDTTNVTAAGALMDSEVTALALIKGLTAAQISGSGDVRFEALNAATSSYATKLGQALISASVLSSPSQGTVRLATNGVNTDVDTGLQAGDSPTFTNLTLTGDLEVQGTTTTIDSTTLDIGDNIIALNGTGAALGGLHVNDANGPASGSILWDGTANQWIAGASGSEVKILRSDGDDVISGSASQVRTFLNVEDGADVTDTTNVTAAGALMDSELAEIATVKALTAAGISGSFVSASNALGSRIDNITSTITLSADSGTNDTYTTGETLTFSGDNSITTTVSDNEITISIANDVVSGSAQIAADISGSGNVRFEALNAVTSSYATKLGLGIVSASVLSSPSQGTVRLAINGVNTDVDTGLQTGDTVTFANVNVSSDVTINGNLTTTGTVTNINTSDLSIEDKFILLNSGSASGNSGIIAQNSSTTGVGTALFFDDTDNRWSLDYAGANANTDAATADARIAAVAIDDTDANYQKDGNIFINDSGDVFIYVE